MPENLQCYTHIMHFQNAASPLPKTQRHEFVFVFNAWAVMLLTNLSVKSATRIAGSKSLKVERFENMSKYDNSCMSVSLLFIKMFIMSSSIINFI